MSKRVLAKSLQLGIGSHDLGNATSIVAKSGILEIEITPIGAFCTHNTTKRKVFIPFSNIKSIVFDFKTDFHGVFNEQVSDIKEEAELEKVKINTSEAKKAKKQ